MKPIYIPIEPMTRRILYVAMGLIVGTLAGCALAPNTANEAPRKGSQRDGERTAPIVPNGPLPAFPASAGSATPKANETDTEREVRSRAQARWQALISGDMQNAYAFLSPSSKLAHPFELYKSRIQPGSWKEAAARRADCEEQQRCRVSVSVKMKVVAPRAGMIDHEAQTLETWVLDGGTWWYVHP
jgi:hypothetical protein